MKAQDNSHGTSHTPAAAHQTNTLPVLRVPHGVMLPDNDSWENRFEIRSATSNRVYRIAQHRKRRHWGCSCPSYRTRRRCKHLEEMGLPSHERPYEARIEGGKSR
jgi:hypothetical protein